ncbi:MAG: hypothetical protein OCD01_02260 [Fibrobacterales bacterium]
MYKLFLVIIITFSSLWANNYGKRLWVFDMDAGITIPTGEGSEQMDVGHTLSASLVTKRTATVLYGLDIQYTRLHDPQNEEPTFTGDFAISHTIGVLRKNFKSPITPVFLQVGFGRVWFRAFQPYSKIRFETGWGYQIKGGIMWRRFIFSSTYFIMNPKLLDFKNSVKMVSLTIGVIIPKWSE